jgi:hypothetical protein
MCPTLARHFLWKAMPAASLLTDLANVAVPQTTSEPSAGTRASSHVNCSIVLVRTPGVTFHIQNTNAYAELLMCWDPSSTTRREPVYSPSVLATSTSKRSTWKLTRAQATAQPPRAHHQGNAYSTNDTKPCVETQLEALYGTQGKKLSFDVQLVLMRKIVRRAYNM